MKFTGAALLVLLTSTTNVASYSPSFVPKSKFSSSFVAKTTLAPKQQQRRSHAQASLSMFTETSGGMEELQDLTEKADTVMLSKQVRKSPSLWKIAGYATIPISAALGFGLVPSRRFAAHTVGALVTGIAGAVGKSRLDAITEANAKPAIAQALLDAGVEDPVAAASAVQTVKEQYGLLDEDFAGLCTEIYATYLQGMLKYQPVPKTSEIKELETVKTALSMDNLQVGEAHAAAASEWYRTTCLFTPEEELEDPEHPDRQAMDKLLFLTERALMQGGETQEAFNFEMTRVAKALNLDLQEAVERVAETVEPFYVRALKSTRSKLGTDKVSSGMLERARASLGVSDETAFDMHVACYNSEVRALLGLGEADEESKEEVDKSQLLFSEDAMERVRICSIVETNRMRVVTIKTTVTTTGTLLQPQYLTQLNLFFIHSWISSRIPWA